MEDYMGNLLYRDNYGHGLKRTIELELNFSCTVGRAFIL